MNDPSSHDDADFTHTFSSASPLAAILKQFESQWEIALQQVPAPDPKSFLQQIDERDRARLEQSLEEIERRYRARLSAARKSQDTQRGVSDPTLAWLAPSESPPSNNASEGEATATFVPSRPAEASDPEITLPADGSSGGAPSPGMEATEFWNAEIGQRGRSTKIPADTRADERGKGSGPRLPSIPGYDIMGVLGRGGMSIVYRARQQSLKRVVALKMMRGDVTPEALTRFFNEAEAVAEFQHPNIVQIYEVGKCNGDPYCALEFVEGSSLDDQWGHEPMAPARAASITETLARAMHYAHQKKIVHRDLKPSNVLLTSEGVPKICDFGIVKRIEDDDSSQTRTGVIMGTPSYMAPEQAWGEKETGAPADIYALGAILYALLTGRPPFAGANAVETVMQVRTEEPIAPSRLQPKVPRDLETICVKCLQKDPAKRYATAEELAEDLRRYQAGEPILARPVSRTERAVRWCRRNPYLAASSGLAAALLLVALIGGWWSAALINQEKQATEKALGLATYQERQAVAARNDAQANEKKAVAASALAQQNEQKAVAAQQEAEENAVIAGRQSTLALDAISALVYEVQDKLTEPRLQPLRQALLTTALNRVTAVAGEAKKARKKSVVQAAAHRRLGDIYLEIGQFESALEHYQLCRDIIEPLHHQNQLGNAQQNLSLIYLLLGDAAVQLDRLEEAEQYYLRSLEYRQQWLAAGARGIEGLISDVYYKLGLTAIRGGDPAAARDWYEQSATLREQWLAADPNNPTAQQEVAGIQDALGTVLMQLNDLEQADARLQRSLTVLTQLSEAHPTDLTLSTNVGILNTRLGELRLTTGDAEAAQEYYREGVKRLEKAHERDPVIAIYRLYLSQAYYGLATAQLDLKLPESQENYQHALRLRQELADESPDNPALQIPLMLALARCGQHADAANLADKLLQQAPEDPRRLYHVACGYALCAGALTAVDDASAPPGADDKRREYEKQAIAILGKAIESGYNNGNDLRRDPDLAPVRKLEGYQALLRDLEEPTASE